MTGIIPKNGLWSFPLTWSVGGGGCKKSGGGEIILLRLKYLSVVEVLVRLKYLSVSTDSVRLRGGEF